MSVSFNLLIAFRNLTGGQAIDLIAKLIAADPIYAANLMEVDTCVFIKAPGIKLVTGETVTKVPRKLYEDAKAVWNAPHSDGHSPKVEAIKVIKNGLRVGLKDAKDLAEHWFDGREWPRDS